MNPMFEIVVPSGYVKIAIENGHRNSEFSKMVIFHSYASLPEGIENGSNRN